MGKLILVRHGESSGNRDRVFALNPADLPLTELGYRQAAEVAARIAVQFRPNAVMASPFLRARETARVIAENLGLPLEIEPRLYERDVGILVGRSYDSLAGSPGYDRQSPWKWRPEGGESYEDVRARVAPVLDRLAVTHFERDIVIVSHGGVMQTLWAHVTGQWQSAHVPPNCGLVVIGYGPEGYSTPQIMGDDWSAADTCG
jgi:broad specificity phosphatase PhoE